MELEVERRWRKEGGGRRKRKGDSESRRWMKRKGERDKWSGRRNEVKGGGRRYRVAGLGPVGAEGALANERDGTPRCRIHRIDKLRLKERGPDERGTGFGD